jgi:hypothetical protein
MINTYNLYCDESTHLENDGMPYMLLGYVCVPYHQLVWHKQQIEEIKDKHHFFGEIKWSKVSKSKHLFYQDIIDYFFASDLAFRAIVVRKDQIISGYEGETYDSFYYKMYYQLIHHKLDMTKRYNIYLDIKDNLSAQKVGKLKDILQMQYGVIQNLQNIRSHESVLMQVADLLMGAINYHLRGERKMIAKNKIIQRIQHLAKHSLEQSTARNEDKMNLFFIELRR